MDKIDIEIMDDMMQQITQTDAWARAQLNDPAIKYANRCFRDALERAGSSIPCPLRNELTDAVCGIAAAYGDAGILFGIRLSNAMREVAANPEALTRYVLERTGKVSA